MKLAAVAALALIVATPVLAGPASAVAQSWAYPDQARTWSSYSRYGYDFNGQRDRPGDYRCDAYWDRGRSDCDARWRDQRPFARTHVSDYRHAPYRSDRRHPGQRDGQSWYGAYGRPDRVYPAGGWQNVRHDDDRSAWCSARYRSYDPATGYYRAYSGRLIFCG
jgi:hypothetical protein